MTAKGRVLRGTSFCFIISIHASFGFALLEKLTASAVGFFYCLGLNIVYKKNKAKGIMAKLAGNGGIVRP